MVKVEFYLKLTKQHQIDKALRRTLIPVPLNRSMEVDWGTAANRYPRFGVEEMPLCDPLASDSPDTVDNPGWWTWGLWAAALAWWCSV